LVRNQIIHVSRYAFPDYYRETMFVKQIANWGEFMRKKIAITGGIGSGKSLAAKYVADMGYPVFSCDEINRELWQNSAYIEKIKALFPACVSNGKVDKNVLKSIVFNDETALKKLNETAHPMIMERLYSKMNNCESALIFAEVPLLFEEKYEDDFDVIIIITRALDKRIQAVQQRDGFSIEEVLKRISAQFDYSTLENRIKNLTAYVIKNDGDEMNLKEKIIAVVSNLK